MNIGVLTSENDNGRCWFYYKYGNIGRLKQSLNLSAYKYIVCETEVSVTPTEDYIYLSVSQDPNITSHTGYTASQAFLPPNNNGNIIQLTVSNLSGNYFIYIHRKSPFFMRRLYLANN